MSRLERLGPYLFRQPGAGGRLGRDSVELAKFAPLKPGWSVCELGCGAGAILLLLKAREPTLALTGIELDGGLSDLARENLQRNGVTGDILTGDVRDPKVLQRADFDLVIANPPYFKRGAGRPGPPARSEQNGTLDAFCALAGRLLRPGGAFAVAQRPERLSELFSLMGRYRLEPKRLQLLCHTAQSKPSALLAEGRKGGRPGLEILPVQTVL